MNHFVSVTTLTEIEFEHNIDKKSLWLINKKIVCTKIARMGLGECEDDYLYYQEEDADIRMTESGSLMQNPSVSFHHQPT